MNFTKQYGRAVVGDPVAAGSSIDQASDIIDMSGFDSITFLVPIVDSVATGVATLTIEQSDDNADTDMTAIDGAVSTVTCAVNDDINGQFLEVEVSRPEKRYVQAVITSGTANIAFGNTIAIKGEPRTKPVAADDTLAATALVCN
jgi:hypothetical protein